jgi:hypothetical protein
MGSGDPYNAYVDCALWKKGYIANAHPEFFKSKYFTNPTKRFFYDTQYHPIPQVEKDSYVIKKDLYVRI